MISTIEQTDRYGGITTVQGEATGFFHLEKVNGRHWFIDPLGNGFFPLGISHLFSGDSEPTVKQLYDYDQAAWMRDWFDKYRSLGFNCAPAGATSPCRDKAGFVDLEYAEDLFTENDFPFAAGVWQFPHPAELRFHYERQDVFSNYYEDLIEERAAYACGRHRDNPCLLGYYYGFGGFINAQWWVNRIFASHPHSAGRGALSDVLIEKYQGDSDAFNAVYGTNCRSLEELKSKVSIAYDDTFNSMNEAVFAEAEPSKKEDFKRLIEAIALRTYRVAEAAVRRHDRNHVILGMYTKATSFDHDLWSKVTRHADVSSPQHVNPKLDFFRLYEVTGKPIWVSDQTFGHGCNHRSSKPGPTEGEMAELYRLIVRRVLGDPRVCGVSICRTLYDLVTGPMVNKHHAFEGIYDEEGMPRDRLIATIKQENQQLYERALTPLPDVALRDMQERFVELHQQTRRRARQK